jgi:hypothetical protein
MNWPELVQRPFQMAPAMMMTDPIQIVFRLPHLSHIQSTKGDITMAGRNRHMLMRPRKFPDGE